MTTRSIIGTDLNQVPTNGMLGGLAYQSPDHASITNLDLKNISAINAETVDTAVDIFVYDTSKDSDGGAWRKRTQHTSWYNETLNTATRGSRREFPAVAVIVAEVEKLTIYDGDDPDLPMWMVFEINQYTNGGNLAYTPIGIGHVASYPHNSVSLSSVHMLNGFLFIGGDRVANAASVHAGYDINFISEVMHEYLHYPTNATRTSKWELYGNISQRNSTDVVQYPDSRYKPSGTDGGFLHVANDVAMTVLPNAPIDSATGLPIPTIAVATDGGVSVIKDDGTVVSSAGDAAGLIEYLDNNYLIITRNNNTGYFAVHNNHFTSGTWNANANAYYSATIPVFNQSGYINGIAASKNGYFGNSIGVHIYDALSSSSTNTNGLFSNITTSYNTGWMHGDIKGAFLSDTDATNVTGSELVTNGTFDTDSDWSKGTNWTIGSGVASHTGSQGYLTQEVFTVGNYYALTFTVTGTTILAGGTGITPSNASYTNGTYTHYGYAISTTLNFYSNVTTTLDNVSVRLADPDRSVNSKGLAVYGTITKSAVATGAELVAYSGWSASNYLEQPYNSDLNYGTGDFYFGGWFKGAGYSDSLIGRLHDSSSAGKGFLLSVSSSGGGGVLVFAIYTLGFQSSGRTTVGTTTNETGKGWQQVWGIRRGGTMELWLNGNLVTTGSNSADISDTTYNPPLFIGAQHGSSVFDGELALMRTGGSAPSPEQIKKIYEDEKVLFQENAACTLYGTSDAVTALAYDDTTDLLHVGTSSGRSEFKGLRRVSNTTIPVTTAISASNGLVAEQ